jgi:uncharacterized protein (TIGR03546 family)
MLSQLVRPVRRVATVFLENNSPRQLAAGFALGMVLGLVPKGNLIAVSLCVLLFSLRVNTGLGLVAALFFSATGSTLDPFADKLGMLVLSAGSLQPTYAAIYSIPLAPWFELNNTVVVGSLLIGLYFVYPAYWLTYVAFCRIRTRRLQWTLAPRAAAQNCDDDQSVDRRAA